MKSLLLTTILILSFSGYSQKAKPPIFTYNWQISNGTFIVTFANTPWGDVGTSTDATGTFTTSCVQTYLDFIVKLLTYGNTPAHWDGITDHTDGLDIILQNSHPFILMVDSQGRVWKLTKPNALLLAAQLNQPMWIASIPACPDAECTCVQSNKK